MFFLFFRLLIYSNTKIIILQVYNSPVYIVLNKDQKSCKLVNTGRVAKLADALRSGRSEGNLLGVQVSPRPPKNHSDWSGFSLDSLYNQRIRPARLSEWKTEDNNNLVPFHRQLVLHHQGLSFLDDRWQSCKFLTLDREYTI